MNHHPPVLRHDWTQSEIIAFFELPFNDLLYQAHSIHRAYFDPNEVQASSLLSIKTGGCPEDCAYCPQSTHHNTQLDKEILMQIDEVKKRAQEAKANGATRFCMGAAWRNPQGKSFERVLEMIKAVNELGLESCVTLGMLTDEQVIALEKAGLDYYNHNLDTSPEHYQKIITTRTYQDRLDTLEAIRKSNIKVCCGGIVGMGETREDRCQFLLQLANLPEHPQSVPINRLVTVKGTPLEQQKPIDDLEFVKTIAIARIIMPGSVVRLSAGRETMSELMQAVCFYAGANSIFYGEKLLTTPNPETNSDILLLNKLGIRTAGVTPVDMPTH